MAGREIGKVTHSSFGEFTVFETKNGARLYGIHPEIGQLPFQSKSAQKVLRTLVIAAGLGHKISDKSSLSGNPATVTIAPEKALEVSTGFPEECDGAAQVSVTDLAEATQKKEPEKAGSGSVYEEEFYR